jgi:hypothetical protein
LHILNNNSSFSAKRDLKPFLQILTSYYNLQFWFADLLFQPSKLLLKLSEFVSRNEPHWHSAAYHQPD